MSANTFTYALSWSRLSDFLQCPRKFKYKYIDKLSNFTAQQESPHLLRGSNVHKALENYTLARLDGKKDFVQDSEDPAAVIKPSSLPEVETTKPLINSFMANYAAVVPEQQISVDINWKQVDWFSKQSYYRAILDLVAISPRSVAIVDYKTGKFKDYSPNGPGQLELSATIGMNMWPEVEVVDTMYAYVDHKKTIKRSFTPKEDKERLTTHFIQIHERVNSEKNWDPTKNEFCNFCEATKLQCQFSRKLSM